MQFPVIRNIGLNAMLVTVADKLSDASTVPHCLSRRAGYPCHRPDGETSSSLALVFIRIDPLHPGHADLHALLVDLFKATLGVGVQIAADRRQFRAIAINAINQFLVFLPA